MVEPRTAPEKAGSDKPLVATVCNYNGGEVVLDCLQALKDQTATIDQIVVYDNASTDDSVARIRERFPDVRVVDMGSNDGPGPVRNRGLQEAESEWVLQVDSDVILEPRTLQLLWEELQRTEREGTPPAVLMPRAVFDSDRSRIHYDGGFFHYVGLLSLDHFFAPIPEEAEKPTDIDGAISMALLLHRPTLLEVGGYDPAFFILFEDHDLSYRLRSAGHRIRRVPEALVYHREGTPGISYREGPKYPARRAFLHSRNRWMVLLRNHSFAALFWGMPGILAYELVWIAFATLQGNLGAYCKGKVDLARKLRHLLRQRREIQSRRIVNDRSLLANRSLTHAPMVNSGKWRRTFEATLNGALRGWWALARHFLSSRTPRSSRARPI